jgi:predicted SAM-dependent methyltransferase
MISQQYKDLYFSALKPVARLNHWIWKVRLGWRRRPSPAPVLLNVGSGSNYLPGFINIEGNLQRKREMWLDLRNGLPYGEQTVDGIYACHVLEHFYLSDLRNILRECRRTLKSGKGIRIVVPSLEQAAAAYVAGKREWFPEFPSAFQSLGGRFFNFIFCDGQHRCAFDFSFFQELLTEAGFRNIRKACPGASDFFSQDHLAAMESRQDDILASSLIVEAQA